MAMRVHDASLNVYELEPNRAHLWCSTDSHEIERGGVRVVDQSIQRDVTTYQPSNNVCLSIDTKTLVRAASQRAPKEQLLIRLCIRSIGSVGNGKVIASEVRATQKATGTISC